MAFDLPRNVVVPVGTAAVRVDPQPHPFERAHADAIAANWRREIAANPMLFNGVMMLLSRLRYDDGELSGLCHAVNYATFLYWRSITEPLSAEHAYAHAVLATRDNALVAIRMAAHTAAPGRVYFASGSFELADCRDGVVDLEANMWREVGEETGLDLATAIRDAGYHLYSRDGGTAIFRRFWFDDDADTLARRITDFVARQAEPEIVGPIIIRNADDLPDGIAPHTAATARWHFSDEGQSRAKLPVNTPGR